MVLPRPAHLTDQRNSISFQDLKKKERRNQKIKENCKEKKTEKKNKRREKLLKIEKGNFPF